jgi:hypothetical protein
VFENGLLLFLMFTAELLAQGFYCVLAAAEEAILSICVLVG